MVERAFNLQCSLKHGLGGSNLLNIYGSLTSKDFSEFFSVLCPIKYFHMRHFSSCLSQHGRLSLLLFAFLASSSYPFSGLSFFFFLLRLFYMSSAFHLLCFHHGSQQKGPLVLFLLLHLAMSHPSENGVTNTKPSTISKFHSVCEVMRKKFFVR